MGDAEFWFGYAMGVLSLAVGLFIWAMLCLRRPTDFNQYEVE